MVHIEGKNLAELATEARKECEKDVVHNLVLNGVFPHSETECTFIKTYDSIAGEWQAPDKPHDLLINHGQYIHRYGDGLGFLVEELRKKADSNRACLSLINMRDILNSHDDPIPSFMILQFGFPESARKMLLATAYFRALEVACFLPINLAEICHIIRKLRSSFPEIEHFCLTINAFKAYVRRNFHCLRKATIDTIEPTAIAFAVGHKNISQLKDWLDSKINIGESAVFTDGLHHLRKALEMYIGEYNKQLLTELDNVISDMIQLKSMRQSSSHGKALAELEEKVRNRLKKAKELL